MTEEEIRRAAEKKVAQALGVVIMDVFAMKKASEALLAIYNPDAMPTEIAEACSKLILWCAAKASAEASAIYTLAKQQ